MLMKFVMKILIKAYFPINKERRTTQIVQSIGV